MVRPVNTREQTPLMANLASALKEEISRLARKEIRQQTAGTAKTAAQCERDIAALKRQIGELQNKLSSLRTQDTPGSAVSKKSSSKKAVAKNRTVKTASSSGKQSSRARFSAKGLKASRVRLGLSADNYGKLVGVSGLSIYNWEQGKARPRESSVAALMAIRGIGKREAAKRLEALATSQPKAKAKAPATRSSKNTKSADGDQAKSES